MNENTRKATESELKRIDDLAQLLIEFKSIEEMGPDTIRWIGNRIQIVVENIRDLVQED